MAHLPADYVTNRTDCNIYPRTHNLVPPVNTFNQEYRIVKAAGAAKRVRERRIGREVRLNRLSLLRWRRLCQAMYYARDFFHYMEETDPLACCILNFHNRMAGRIPAAGG